MLKDPAALTDELLINDAGTLKKITLQQVKALVLLELTTIPIGTITDFAGADAPEGWLLCYGQEVSRDTYSALFTVLGASASPWGLGNGSSSFNVPDLRGYVTAGVGNMGGGESGRLNGIVSSAMAASGGAQTVALSTGHLPAHRHAGVDHLHYIGNHSHLAYGTPAGGSWGLKFGGDGSSLGHALTDSLSPTQGPNTGYTAGTDRDLTTGYTGSDVAHNNVQPTCALNKIIRAI